VELLDEAAALLELHKEVAGASELAKRADRLLDRAVKWIRRCSRKLAPSINRRRRRS